MEEFLVSVQLESLASLFQKEHISMDVLVEMSNEDLQSIGITAFGHRHKILRKVRDLLYGGEELGTYVKVQFMCNYMYMYMYISYIHVHVHVVHIIIHVHTL